jgi:hypothetical protein
MCNIKTICRLCGTSEGIKVNIFDPKRTYVSTIHQLLPIMVRGMNCTCVVSVLTSKVLLDFGCLQPLGTKSGFFRTPVQVNCTF